MEQAVSIHIVGLVELVRLVGSGLSKFLRNYHNSLINNSQKANFSWVNMAVTSETLFW